MCVSLAPFAEVSCRLVVIFFSLLSSARSSSLKIFCHVYWDNEDLFLTSLPVLLSGDDYYSKVFF